MMAAHNYKDLDSGSDTFSPASYLINTIKRAISNSQNIKIDGGALGEIVVLSSEGEYFCSSGNLEELCKANASKFKITILDKSFRNHDTNYVGRNIDELMWTAGFYASEGRLMEGCYRDDVVEMVFWPNFTRLPSTPNSMRLAALLSSHPTSIALAHRFLRIEKEEAYQFYSAARCAGLVRAVNRAPEEPPLKPHRNQALLGLLLNKIARI
ncbi:MAG: hypothetical protein OEY61_07370 [Gammaproteobacteria bacterium]|nr:hypothetical protein [Gammaproteobacteria bacterium]